MTNYDLRRDRDLLNYMIDRQIAELEAARSAMLFRLEGVIVPKARPRSTRTGHVYTQGSYSDWKSMATKAFEEIKTLYPGYTYPLQQCNAFYVLDGKYSRQGDGDNIAGAINDALVDSSGKKQEKDLAKRMGLAEHEEPGILKGDNLNCIPSQTIALNYHKNRPPSLLVCLY